MTTHEPAAAPSDARGPIVEAESPDHGISLVSVLIALAVLAALVAGIFWGLPAWFGSSVVNLTVRQ